MAVAAPGEKTLAETPTWAVAVVCAVLVLISVIIEHGIHFLGKIFQKRHKKAMTEALEKIKAELMLVGFISLLLTVSEIYIPKICIPSSAGSVMPPCSKEEAKRHAGKGNEGDDDNGDHKRKLLGLVDDFIWRRQLASATDGKNYCAKGKVSLITKTGVHDLHIFIFVLAAFHVLYSVMTMVLGQAKMKKRKAWETETSSSEYQSTNDPARYRFTHQTSFVKRHSGLSTKPGIRWVVAFFRQFFGSIKKVDYLTMRNGFINRHVPQNPKFDFSKYIKISLEDDFKVVVGISVPLWIFAILILLLNIYTWHTLFWMSFIPLIILLAVGTKLERVLMEMALQIQERSSVVAGAPVVEPNNNLFWFNSPQWILYLIQFTIFQNAFQMAYLLWIWYEFGGLGLKSCLHEDYWLTILIIRVFLGIAVLILCSYITFPLYALVTQMGSHMKTTIFKEQTIKALEKWSKAAKDKSKARKAGGVNNSSACLQSADK
ncbi:hypothetical protein MKW98_008746 [Papaver atlanticum]|uniref:MLO-like protein n=1 Tax=Papaver atlanticum TaxID=357466 RepID=A0AAD4TEK8_9MAGN|nr:hypothetical protein MKW98_008746 [Papaver atlanticum]